MDNIQKHFSAAALCAAFLFFAAFASFGQNVIYQCDFEDATENAEWTLANGSQTNQWYIGTAASNGGSNSLYITNDGGESNTYDNGSTSYVYAYREINVTETAWYNLELDWRLNGQYYYDIMKMFLIPTSVNPDLSAGNPNGMEYSPYSTPSGWIGATGVLYGYSEWTHVFIEQEIEAGTYYLVLFWKNNNSYGENPAAAIDNISIAKNNCVSISNVWVEDVEAESATIVWEERGTATSWDIVISLDYLEDADLESADFITVTDMTYSLTGLEPLTYYYIYVRAACSNNEHSLWKSTSFETPRIPATLPYSFGFEDDTENANWELSDEADNLWAIGTAVSNGGEKGLYISENRGISNTYNNSKQSYAYAFRTINITEPDEYQFDFDWRANGGDSGYDLLRAFVIPTSLDPSISYGYHNDMYSNYNDAPSGWIDASADGLMSGQPRWQHSSKVLDLDAGTYYFVFFWKNSDGGDGNNPPAAIDNISILRVINPAVTTSSVSDIFSTSATVYGTLLSQGVSDVTERGFEYGTDRENLSGNIQSADNTDDFSSVVTGLAPNTTYYYRAYATNSEGTGYGTIKSFTTNGSYSGFDFVDLGLPSKTYWATMNIGATSTEDMGDYFAWGETTPKDTYEWSTYQYCNGSDESMTKYCNNPDFGDNGFTDNLTTLEASDDAATANWGSGWRMPIADEAEELYTYCSHVWTTQNGVTGRLFTGPNGRSIFLPGIYNGMSNHYWTNSLYSSYPSEATTLLFGSGTRAELGDYYRYDGLPVRAVYRVAPYLATVSQSNVTLSLATLSGLSYDNGNSDVIERGFQYGTNPDNLTETIQSELGANEFTATLTGLVPNTTYYYRAYATNSDDTGYGEIKSFRTPSGQLGDHYYVDLGLPSGTLWATTNVGAYNIYDMGNEYAWGETTVKDSYEWDNYSYCNGSSTTLTKYCNDSYYGNNGFTDDLTTLEATDDAAAVNWNEDWVMPTQADMQELIDYCDTTWTIINGIVGLLFTSGNGNSIFIPTEYDGYTLYAYYWTSSLNTDNPTSAVYMNLYPGDYESDPGLGIGNIDRSYHAHVRPVYKVAPTAFELGDEPYSCDFENADENAQWVLANGRQPSKWYIGTAASNGGANGLYISADDGAHNSYNFAEPSSTYAYRLINITTADLYQFDFDWRAAGNEDYDYLRAFLIPASIDPDLAPGAGYDPDWINICSTEIMSEQSEWQHSRTAVNIEETGMYYLAFFWENDDYYYGNNPSAAIDNISICKATNFFIDNRDGNIYSFVTIGDQTWLAENLRYAGNIQLGTEISETVPYFYYPDGNEYNVSTYGYLYNWSAAMNGEESSYETPSGVQGICPEGWHLPSEQEWVQLDDYLGRNNTGSMLAGYADSWFYGSLKQSEYFGATGFNALPAGVYSGTSIEFGHITRFWTTTTSVNNSDLIYHKDIISTYTTLYSDINSKDFGNSVRCVRNTGSIAATLPYDCDFEDDTENANWVLANGDETNKWYIGSATNNGGNNGLYISNDGGTTNAYTSTSESVVYAYRSIDIDENAFYEISFDWRSFGDVDNFDGILGVFMAPVSSDFDLSGGNNLTVLPDGWIVIAEEPLAGAPFWLNFSNTIYIDEGNYNLIFYWANEDNGGDLNPPAAIDNVSVTKVANPIVATSSVSDISATSATLHGSILSHGASDITVRGFEYGTDEGNLTEIVQSTDETNDFSVSLTNLASNTTYYYRAYATNSDDTGYGEIKMFTTNGIIDDHDFVDLGLPSGNKWATCNVGASIPEGFGNYYGWGETYNKEIGDWTTYIYYNGSSFTKYTRSDGRSTLEAMDDAATVNWGDGWRMPTKDEVSELFNNCSSIWTTLNGVNGRLFTSNLNGNTIFLPAAGKVNEGGYENDSRSGTYWSSSFRTTSTNEGAWDYEVYPDVCELGSLGYRKYGRSVRAIYTLAPTVVTNNATYLTSTSATLNASITDNGNSEIIERGFKYGTDRNNLSEIVQSNDATSDFSVTITGLAPNTTYYYVAYATNSDATDYAGIKSFSTNGIINGHEYVDLGLPSGTKWAACNIGTDEPYDLGDYFAWGETTSKDVANWDTYIYYDNGSITKYTDSDGLTTLEATDDAATVNWGSNWRMPTKEEMEEMLNNCDNVWTTWNGVEGRLFTSHINGNSFFMPAAGKQDGSEIFPDGGHYWSSTLRPNDIENAWNLFFDYSSCDMEHFDSRKYGQAVRAINRRSPSVVTNTADNITSTAATLHGNISNIGASEIIESGFEYGINRENLNESVQCTDGTNDFSVSLSNLASGTTYYYRAYATNSDDTGYGEIKYFSTPCDNLCSIIYSFTDDYGDGWNGNAINVVEVGTGIVIESLTLDNGSVASGTVEICDGKEIIFEWVEGYYSEETSYQILDANEDEIFSGSGALSSPVSYTMSCPSCRMVTDFTIANITTESATISFTGHVTATSWELIVSETELDDADLENYNNAIILTESSYSATGLTFATQYYVYVRSVCSVDDKSRWKIGAFNTAICAPEDMCGISYELASEISIGWSGGAINIVDVESEIVIATLTIDQGYSATGILDVCDGKEISIDYTAGQYPDFVSYHIFDANGDEIDSYNGLDSPTSHSQLYTVSCPTCRPVKNIRATEITTESATIRWADYGSAESWEIIVSDEEIDNNALDGNDAIVQSADSSFVATGLTSSTNYYVYVHALCLGNDESQWRSYSFTTTQIPATIPYTCDFEDTDENTNWVLANGNQTNQWHIGEAASNGGENGLYISNDDGVSNEYDINSTSVVYAYRTIDIEENAIYTISFDWKSNGNGSNYSAILGVFLAPASSDFDLSGGNDLNYLTYDWIYLTENPLADATSWQNFTKIINIDEGSYNLIFYWINRDGGGENPPAAIDNISIKVNEVATIPYTCDFEDADENANWILANGDQTNQWHIGEAANNGGENGLYISDDDGTSNEYDINSPSVVYAYRTIDIDEDDIYEISLDWRSNGDGDTPSALLGVFLAPVSSDFNLVGGNDLDNLDDWIIITEEPLADATSWQNFTKIINIVEGSYNLIFYWANRNDGGENPPAAIDNISINSLTPDISVTYPMDRSTTGADIIINYSPFTDDENYTMLLHYGSNRNIIYHIVYANYNSTNEFYYAEITNLEPDTKYYYYAEARSEFGTFQSDTLWFYTLDEMIDDRDNHRYHTIRIGNQIWMAEDLNYAGNIPQGTLGETSSTEPYRYATEYCTEYSTKLYNWSAAMNLASSSNENPSGVQGVCPNGWHLPSEAEWQELYDTLGGSDRDAGSQMIHSWINAEPISESEYLWASGLDAYYSNWYSGSYEGNCENATFWSATANNTDEAYYHRIYSGSTDLLSGSSEKGYGFNVRCVKGTTYYTFDTLPYCGESYTFGTQIITESGDYTRIVNLGEDTDSIYKLHITFVEIPVATISDFSNGCFGQNNGYATVSVEGGTAPYNYAWNIPEAQNSATLSNLAEGEYTVVVTDANGCSATSSVEITTPDEIAVSITDTACNSYDWNGTTYTETGEYTQTLHTAEGCDSVVTLRLTINHSSTGEFTDLMCAGVPYTYGNETFTEAGTYTVTLTNSVGCDSIVTLTLTYADNCNGIISGVITDDYTGDLIPNARVTIGNNVTYTNAEGQYSLEVLRGRKTLRVSAVEYISHSEIIDIQGDTTINIALNSPRIITSDNISLTTYPYLEQTDTITITNTGNGTLVWSSITEYDGLALVEDSTIQRRNSRSLWDSIQTFATRENAEQAVVTDGFFIYTSSWMRPGEFNRYTPSGEYVETFFIENVGMIRNLSYNGNYFYGTDATNVILKLDLDNQTLLGSIETDIPEIRHCSFNRQDGSLLAGDWNSLYRIDTTSGTSQQIRSDLANVYSSAFDNLSAGGPYLWLFSQTSQDNGPSACIRQFDISANDFTDKIHYLDDIEISDASLAGGICASEYVCEGKFVLLANVQNPSGSNTIATYEIGRTNSVARAERKSGSIAPSESESIPVRASATETGEYASTIKYRAAVMGRQSNDVIVSISSIAPECDAVQQITATNGYSAITLEWQPVELGEYNNVSYLVYTTASQYAIDTLSGTSATYRGLPNGEHCFYVRALSSAGYTCLSEASDTVCAEIKDSPCDIPLFVEARSDGETITVSWNQPADVDNFSIYRDGESIAENLTTTSFVDTDVVPETDYCYTVVARLGSGFCNEISGTACMRILTGVCTEVPVLTADAIGNSVILKWTECDGAVNYRIFRDNEFVGTTTGIYYSDNVPEPGSDCYVVESDCEHGMYKRSNEECVFADAIDEWSADNLTLYPNPTYGQFFIEGQHIATVQIFNAIGQLVAEIENTEDERITVNCDDWNPGLYSVRIVSTEGETATRKVTIFK